MVIYFVTTTCFAAIITVNSATTPKFCRIPPRRPHTHLFAPNVVLLDERSINVWILTTHAVRTVPPSKPVILDGATRAVCGIEERYNEGSDVNLICEVRGGKPPPKLTWYLDNTVIDESYHYATQEGVTVNHLAYPKIGRQHLKARLICQASNTNLVSPQIKLLILDVNRKSLTLVLFLYFP